MEKPLYPSYNMRITQGYQQGTHTNSFAIDDAGIDSGISMLRAPFTGIIKKIYPNDANEVWLESIEPVEYPDGTIDYMTIMFAHSNDVSNLFVGKRINQKEDFYSEGTKGNASGNHCHIECGRGKFTGTGWYKNSSGYFSIINGKKPEECLWIDSSVNIINDNNYSFKRINEITPNNPESTIPDNTEPAEPSIPDDTEDQNNDQPTENIPIDEKKLIFTCPKTDLYGIYLTEGQKLYFE